MITDCELFKLPIRDGGLGIPILTQKAVTDCKSSIDISSHIVDVIVSQGTEISSKETIKQVRHVRTEIINDLHIQEREKVISELDNGMKRVLSQNCEKGTSSWLTMLPLKEQGFNLTKDEFRDVLALRYNRKIKNLPSKCACGQAFDTNHAMNCKKGGFVAIRQKNVRDFEANLLKTVCNDVEIEPKLQPIENDEARLDILACGFWCSGQSAYFDVGITNVNSNSQANIPVETIYKNHENEKKRKYNNRVINCEHGSFTPLVFSINQGMSHEGHIFHKHLAEKIANKTGQKYERIMSWIRCKLPFVIMLGTSAEDFSFACDEARL